MRETRPPSSGMRLHFSMRCVTALAMKPYFCFLLPWRFFQMKDKIRYLSVHAVWEGSYPKGSTNFLCSRGFWVRWWDLVSWYWKKGAASPMSLVPKHLNKCICFFCSFCHNIRSNRHMQNNSKELVEYGGKESASEGKILRGWELSSWRTRKRFS